VNHLERHHSSDVSQAQEHLRDLDEECPRWWGEYAPVPVGLRTVRVSRIVGTVGHGRDFRPDWVPFVESERDRLLLESFKVRGFDSNESSRSPISLIEFSGEYFVEGDGHRRVSVAHRLKLHSIQAEVFKLEPKKGTY
jgi:hypothetical protein